MQTVKVGKFPHEVWVGSYETNDQPSIIIWDTYFEEPSFVLTTNLPEYEFETEFHTVMELTIDNEEVFYSLISQELIKDTGKDLPTPDFITLRLIEVLPKAYS